MEYKIRDITIYYEIYGSGKPIFMIHGWSPDHRLMKGCMEPIFQSTNGLWKRIYFDLPGMGRTKGKPWITGSDQLLDLILEFIDGVCPDQQFVVVGQSYGGYLARGIIYKRALSIDGLLLICPLAKPYIVTKNGIQKGDVPDPCILKKDEILLNSLSEEDRSYFEPITVLQNERVWKRFREEILPGLKIADYSFLEKNLGRNVPFSFNVDLLEKPYMKPTLMLMGRQDSACGYRDIWKLIEAYPRASFIILDKAGHNLQIEQDILFGETVKEWLNRVLEETY